MRLRNPFTVARADDLAIEASPLAQEVIALLDSEPGRLWNAKTGELLKALNSRLEGRNEVPKKVNGWPQSAKALSARLKESARNLRRLGLEVNFGPRGKRGYTLYLVYRKPETEPCGSEVPNDVRQVH